MKDTMPTLKSELRALQENNAGYDVTDRLHFLSPQRRAAQVQATAGRKITPLKRRAAGAVPAPHASPAKMGNAYMRAIAALPQQNKTDEGGDDAERKEDCTDVFHDASDPTLTEARASALFSAADAPDEMPLHSTAAEPSSSSNAEAVGAARQSRMFYRCQHGRKNIFQRNGVKDLCSTCYHGVTCTHAEFQRQAGSPTPSHQSLAPWDSVSNAGVQEENAPFNVKPNGDAPAGPGVTSQPAPDVSDARVDDGELTLPQLASRFGLHGAQTGRDAHDYVTPPESRNEFRALESTEARTQGQPAHDHSALPHRERGNHAGTNTRRRGRERSSSASSITSRTSLADIDAAASRAGDETRRARKRVMLDELQARLEMRREEAGRKLSRVLEEKDALWD